MKVLHGGCARIRAARIVSASAMLVAAMASTTAQADDTRWRFKGGIGVIPVSSGVAVAPTPATAPVVESVNRNIVRGVQPAGQIWVIDRLDARVKANRKSTRLNSSHLGISYAVFCLK